MRVKALYVLSGDDSTGFFIFVLYKGMRGQLIGEVVFSFLNITRRLFILQDDRKWERLQKLWVVLLGTERIRVWVTQSLSMTTSGGLLQCTCTEIRLQYYMKTELLNFILVAGRQTLLRREWIEY